MLSSVLESELSIEDRVQALRANLEADIQEALYKPRTENGLKPHEDTQISIYHRTLTVDRNAPYTQLAEDIQLDRTKLVNQYRIMQGMLLIAEYLPRKGRNEFGKVSKEIVDHVPKLKILYSTQNFMKAMVGFMATQLDVNPEQAYKNICLARDKVVSESAAPTVRTTVIDKKYSSNKSTRETEAIRVSPQHIQRCHDPKDTRSWRLSKELVQKWHVHQRIHLGLLPDTDWIGEYYEKKECSISATKPYPCSPPSDRFSPMPAAQDRTTCTKQLVTGGERTVTFTRTGIVDPYQFKEKGSTKAQCFASRVIFAKAILLSLLEQQLEKEISAFKKLYGQILNQKKIPFYINYITLLTPILLTQIEESPFSQHDAEKIKITKAAFFELQEDLLDNRDHNDFLRALKTNHPNIRLHFEHTNVTIVGTLNNQLRHALMQRDCRGVLAAPYLQDYDSEHRSFIDNTMQWLDSFPLLSIGGSSLDEAQLASIIGFIQNPKQNTQFQLTAAMQFLAKLEAQKYHFIYDEKIIDSESALHHELVKRLQSSVALRVLKDRNQHTVRTVFYEFYQYWIGENPYFFWSKDKKNLLLVGALPHALGAQAMTIIGCKSARDRYGLAAEVIAAINESALNLFSWENIARFVSDSLNWGHALVNNAAHVAGCVKLSALAHEDIFSPGCNQIFKSTKQNKYYLKPEKKPLQSTPQRYINKLLMGVSAGFALIVYATSRVSSLLSVARLCQQVRHEFDQNSKIATQQRLNSAFMWKDRTITHDGIGGVRQRLFNEEEQRLIGESPPSTPIRPVSRY